MSRVFAYARVSTTEQTTETSFERSKQPGSTFNHVALKPRTSPVVWQPTASGIRQVDDQA